MTDDLCQSVLVYRSPLRKLDTSSNQLCASLDKACAAGKLLSFRLAGTAGRCGQSTLCIGGLLAHPLNITGQTVSTSKSGIALLPCGNQRHVLHSFFLTLKVVQNGHDTQVKMTF